MAKQKKKKKTAAYAQTKRMISPKDSRIKKPQLNPNLAAKLAKQKADDAVRSVAQTPSGLFFTHNASLGPPYRVLVDTNFINFSIQNKLDIMRSLMDCLYAKVHRAGAVLAWRPSKGKGGNLPLALGERTERARVRANPDASRAPLGLHHPACGRWSRASRKP